MSIQGRLSTILKEHDLLQHPFYQAWSAGTLPIDALQTYAQAYGDFIAVLPQGWETLNDAQTAAEEREHTDLWIEFQAALGAPQDSHHSIPQAAALHTTACQLFASPASALGALYAFEAQQPGTASSKLQGLRAHYRLPQQAETYFQLHSTNWHEAENIMQRIQRLSPEEQDQAEQACRRMASALWEALTGIHEVTCRN